METVWDALIGNGNMGCVTAWLRGMGYMVDGLDMRGIAVLFFGLHDVLVRVRQDGGVDYIEDVQDYVRHMDVSDKVYTLTEMRDWEARHGNDKKYLYCAISKSFGYSYVEVYAGSEEKAKVLGRKEFERQFGLGSVFCSCGDTAWDIRIDEQLRLCQNLMDGYRGSLGVCMVVLREICVRNGLVMPLECHVKYLFVNSVARRYKVAKCCELSGVVQCLLVFLGQCKDKTVLDGALRAEYQRLALSGARKDYRRLLGEGKVMNGVVRTGNAVFMVKDGVVSPEVELRYNGESLGIASLCV